MLHRLSFSRYVLRLTWVALTCTLSVILVLPTHAQAAALGDASVRSTLGQRLDVEVDIAALSANEAESVSVKLAPPEAWSSAGIDLGGLQRSLRLAVEKKDGRYQVRITSDLAVNDPFMHLLIELSANGVRTIRQYVLLIDPPELFNAPIGAASTAVSQADSAPAPAKAESALSNQAEDSAPLQYKVKRGETLRTIAQQLKTEDVELEQLMVALMERNPGAFAGKNMYRLRSGSLLTLPSPDKVRAVELDQARQVLQAHTKDFSRYQRQLSEQSALTSSAKSSASDDTGKTTTTQSSSGSVTIKMTDSGPTPKSLDKLTLSAPSDKQGGANASDATKTIDAVATNKALADANARIATLEKNISEMQSLLDTKNLALAEPRQGMASGAAINENTPAPSAEGSAEKLKAEPPVVASASARSEPTPKPATVPGAVADQAFVVPQIDLWVSAVTAMGLLALVILWRVQRRKAYRADGPAAVPVEPTLAQTVIAGAGGQQIDTAHSVFHSNFVPSLSQIDTHEVDAVAEADVYIAYGRDEQAEEILLDALRQHPERHALRVKLLEIYATRKDRQRFNTAAAELHVLTHGQGPDWARAAELGQALEPHVIDFHLSPTAQTGNSPVTSTLTAGDRPTTLGPITQSTASSSVLNTKLELAMACREIGDHAGARELLSEVAKARDPELAQRAQSLLMQLA
jgi:pilus assembly protein FimV